MVKYVLKSAIKTVGQRPFSSLGTVEDSWESLNGWAKDLREYIFWMQFLKKSN